MNKHNTILGQPITPVFSYLLNGGFCHISTLENRFPSGNFVIVTGERLALRKQPVFTYNTRQHLLKIRTDHFFRFLRISAK